MSSSLSFRGLALALVFGLFFMSGFAALLYQVIWQRLLVFYTGSDTVSISLIVTAFMSGLGLGYLAGGTLSDRVQPRTNLLFFVGAEAGIMLFAAASKFILYDFLYISAPRFGNQPGLVYAVVFAILLVPTFLMGFSLPALSKAFRFDSGTEQARYISLLYFINTLGAAVGAFVTGFFLVRLFGFDHSLWFGVAANGLCAVVALLIGVWYYRSATVNGPKTDHHSPAGAVAGLRLTPALLAWSGHYLLSGMAALSLELIWFRMLETGIKSVSLTFSVLLATYLGSMAMGTVLGAWLLRQRWLRSPARRERLFLWAQILLYTYTALSVALFIGLIDRLDGLRFLFDYFRSSEPVLSFRLSWFTYGLMPLFLLALPTFLMGLSFTLSQSLVQDRYDETGRKVGWLQFVNIVGSALGAWWVTWLGFPLLGTATLFAVVASVGFVYVLLLYIRRHLRAGYVAIPALVLLLCVLALPGNDRFWQVMNGVSTAKEIIFNENESGVSVIKLAPDQQSGAVFVNGLGQSSLPYYTDEVHTLLGALPVLIHPNPRRVAVIGLGSAGTAHGIGSRPETQQIDCFEIVSNQATVLTSYAHRANDSTVRSVLADPRTRLIIRDGRFALSQQPDLYDVIEADALRPTSAYSGNLYSREYFELLRSRLRPGGYAVTWCPTPRIRATFRQVFPYTVYTDELVLIGSTTPITLNWDTIYQRAAHPFTHRYHQQAHIDLKGMLTRYQPHTTTESNRENPTADINTDLFPRDEFNVLARYQN